MTGSSDVGVTRGGFRRSPAVALALAFAVFALTSGGGALAAHSWRSGVPESAHRQFVRQTESVQRNISQRLDDLDQFLSRTAAALQAPNPVPLADLPERQNLLSRYPVSGLARVVAGPGGPTVVDQYSSIPTMSGIDLRLASFMGPSFVSALEGPRQLAT